VTGILVSGGLNTISNNVVGSITAANSIMNAASAGTTAGNIQGIVCSSTLTNSFLSNSVANLTNRYGGTATGSITRGISVTSGLNTISNNTITALATLAPHASVDATASITGISATSTTAGAAQVVSGNTILGLGNGATTGNVNMNGIHFTGSTTFTHQIFRNTISAIGANTSGVAVINGINVVGGTSTVFNNMIALGLDAFGAPLVGSHEFNGIRNTSTTANSFYFNSVHISGSGVGTGIANTSGFRRTATGVDIVRNNIFANTRSNASSGGTHYAINLNLTTTITEDNNDFWGNGTGYVMGIVGVTAYPSLGLWKAGTNLDANSFHANPVFTTSTNLHINNPGVSVLESRGTVIGGITDDIDSQVRPGPVGSVNGGATAPDIGADEFDGFPVLIDVGVSALVTPGTGCPSDTVRYAIKNYASGTLNLAVNPVTVVSFTTGTNPQAFPNVVVNTGTIAAGATMDVVVSTTYSMAAAGTYTFRGYTQLGADVINGNDSLAATNFVVAGGTATSAKSTICELDSSLLTVAGFTNGGSVQWQSSPDNLAWTNIPGATSPTYMAVPTVLTYYRAVVCGLHNSVSDTVNVTIVPPPTVVGDTICGVGTANLSASGSATLQWYDQPSGGTVLTTGTTYSPTVSTTTNYYVANASGNNNGLHTTTYATNNGSSGNAFTVKALNSITITGFDGHTNTTTAGAWEIWYRPNDYLLSPGSQTSNVGWTLLVATPSVPALGTGLVTPIATGLSLTIPAGQTYSFQIFRPNGGVAYTNGTTLGAIYNANVDLEFYQGHGGTAFAGMTISPRVWNGRIHYASGCESPRVMVTATVTPPPAISTTQSAMTSCSGAPVDLIVASGNSGYSYGWAPGTGLNSTVNDTVIATPTVGTTYIVTATDTTLGCVASDTLIVGVANNPTVIATATPDTICAGDSIALTSLTTPIVAQLGNGTIVNTNQSYPAPFGNYFWGSRHQMLILASELQAAGLSAGPISAMSFDVTSLNLAVPHDNFEIKMGLTSVNAITTWQTPTFTSVFTSPSYLPAVGIVPIPFSTNFMWDGLSNIIVETCHNNASYVDNVSVNQSTTAFSSTVFYYQDAAGVCSNIAVTGSIAQRPNLYFWAQGSYGYDWSPNGTLVTPNAANTVGTASATTDFVIMVTDSSTGCVGSDTTNVFANPVPVVNLGNDGYFCGTSTTLDAGNPGANYIWSTLDSTQTLFVNTNGTYDVQVTDSIGCSATDTVSITFSPFPVVNLGADTSACQGSSITLDAGIPGSSYNWSTTATTQTIAVTTTGSYSVALTDTFGCTGNDTVSVTFNALPNVSFVSTVDTVCSFAAAITLTGGSPSGGSYTGPGVTAGVFDPAAAGAGTHTITYDFTDGNGCSASATHVIVVEVCPGVADGFNSFNVGLYPNPNDGRFTFTVAMSADAEVSYEVADARGVVVLRDNSNQPSGVYSQEVNLNDFATGVYTLRVTVDGVTAHKRLVVQR
jgi:hypothetical protein